MVLWTSGASRQFSRIFARQLCLAVRVLKGPIEERCRAVRRRNAQGSFSAGELRYQIWIGIRPSAKCERIGERGGMMHYSPRHLESNFGDI
jgi:hypothetical protein